MNFIKYFIILRLLYGTEADPITIAKTAIGVLGPIVQNYLHELQVQQESESIKIRIWMHNGDLKLNGCGMYIRVEGFAGSVGEELFPNIQNQGCGEYTNGKTYYYRFRKTAQSSMYEKTVYLGNEQVKEIQVHADGAHDTYIRVICIGLNDKTIAGGPQAFCINNDLLKSCKLLTNKWLDVNTTLDNMLFTQTTRGTHKMIFTQIESLVAEFNKFYLNSNDNSLRSICDRIDLIRGRDDHNKWTCDAEHVWTTGFGGITQLHKEHEDVNPSTCQRILNQIGPY